MTSKRKTNKRKPSKRAAAEPSPVPVMVGVHETGRSNQNRAKEVVAELGYQLAECETELEFETALAGANPPDIILFGLPSTSNVVDEARKRGPDRPILIATLAGPAHTAADRADNAGCDLFVVRPLGKDNLASCLAAAGRLAAERAHVQALRGTEERLRERLQHYGGADLNTGLQHIDFFKNFLSMELKRAKRYGYSLAACLVAIDPWGDGDEPAGDAARELRRRVAAAITASMRDIDLPVDYADDRFLAFLPYTDLAGAERVGRRIAASVKSAGRVELGGETHRMSVSVGIAALRPGQPVSFARLIRDASMAVRAAQLKGGGRVVVRK